MPFKLIVNGTEVICDTLAELLAAQAMAASSPAASVPAAPTTAIEAPPVISETEAQINLTKAKEDVEEARTALIQAEATVSLARHALSQAKMANKQAPQAKGTQGRGPTKAWAEAEAYGLKHGLTKFEARAILKSKKTAAVNSALKSMGEA